MASIFFIGVRLNDDSPAFLPSQMAPKTGAKYFDDGPFDGAKMDNHSTSLSSNAGASLKGNCQVKTQPPEP